MTKGEGADDKVSSWRLEEERRDGAGHMRWMMKL